MKLNSLLQGSRNIEWSELIYDYYYRALNKITFFKVLQGITVTMKNLDPKFLAIDSKFTCRFMDYNQLKKYTSDPKHQLTESFLTDAFKKNDHCFAILDGDKLASYGWYSNQPTYIDKNLILNFKNSYIYMYKGYTNDEYRGQRLHAIGMARALEAFTQKGFDGLISYVEKNNFSSLKSCYRMGYKNFGRLTVAKLPGKYFIRGDKNCHEYDFKLIEA